MKFLTYLDNGTEKLGTLSPDGKKMIPLEELGCSCQTMLQLVARHTPEDSRKLSQKVADYSGCIPLEQVQLAAPIPHPAHDIWCLGENYLEHALESARYKGVEYQRPDHPIYFTKRVDRAVAHGEGIRAHADITERLDYESELAVIIGKTCDHAKPDDVFDYIFGYTIVNDVSARDLQMGHVQFAFGKSLDGFTPMGPWIVTADEFQTPPHLQVISRVNGEVRQNSNTSEFIWDLRHIISELSAGIVLQPGDIIITGTPSGVGMGYQPPKFLHVGDVVECEIEGIGILRNTVVE